MFSRTTKLDIPTMADPTPYAVSYSFSGFQATSPASPLPAPNLDNEFANIATTLSTVVSGLSDVRRSDGSLKNGSVGPDQLSSALTNNWRPRGAWDNTGVLYYAGDGVFYDGYFYVCRVQHTSSGDTEPGVDTDTWLVQFALATAVGNMLVSVYDPGFKELDVYDVDNHENGTTNKVFTAAEKTKLSAIEAGATATPYVPAGTIWNYAGATAPTGFLLCYGQAVSRTTYAALFAAIGVVHGPGNGTTTFNLPDGRGRVLAGKDDMGGSAASRLTTGGAGVDGATLGAAGGVQTVALTTAQLAAHTHGVSVTGTAAAGGEHTHEFSISGGSGSGVTARDGGSAAYNGLMTTAPDHTHSVSASGTSDPAGSGTAHSNTQPTLVVNYIIKT